MAVSAHDIQTLLAELEQGDPLDLGEVPLDEAAARRIVVLSMAKFSQDLAAQGMNAETREALALATAARVLLDNLKLHYQLLVKAGVPPQDAQSLLTDIAARSRGV
jgi:hypothetical protein